MGRKRIRPVLEEYVKREDCVEADPDSSIEVWLNVYKNVYEDIWGQIYDFNQLDYYITKNVYRAYAPLNRTCNKVSGHFPVRMAGDVVFNFKNMFDKYEEEMSSKGRKELKYCKEMHNDNKEYLNYAFLPITGNLQGAKQKCGGHGRDRFDVFLYWIDKYYTADNPQIIQKAKNRNNTIYTKAFLDYFKDTEGEAIYNFCDKMYGINCELVDELIESGRQEMEEQKFDLENYMELANRYWKQRRELYRSKMK